MRLKVAERSSLVWNMALFIFCGLFFLYLQAVSIGRVSFLNLDFFISYLKSAYWIISLGIITAFLCLRLKKASLIFLGFFVLGLTASTSLFLASNFSKLILVFLFLFLISSIYLYQFLKEELYAPYLNSLFSESDLFSTRLYLVEVDFSRGEEASKGLLTNWDENGCFVRVLDNATVPRWGQREFVVNYQGHEFRFKGKVVSKLPKTGFGVKIDSSDANWSELYSILQDRGLEPELVL